MRNFIFLFALFLILIQTNCSTEPERDLELIIHDGYYDRINVSAEKTTYSIDFEYSVTGNTCNIGGYGISWGDGKNGSVNWYIMQKLEPGRIYSISDTFKLNENILGYPLISMQGYLVGATEADTRLKAEYQLKSK